mmetsp:Transcript_24679/g.38784  ORF Transcript_24679/g.38784 Transcript_24679/m.38784 type:complete len:230 (-) Transcript_24679:340-1029(-)
MQASLDCSTVLPTKIPVALSWSTIPLPPEPLITLPRTVGLASDPAWIPLMCLAVMLLRSSVMRVLSPSNTPHPFVSPITLLVKQVLVVPAAQMHASPPACILFPSNNPAACPRACTHEAWQSKMWQFFITGAAFPCRHTPTTHCEISHSSIRGFAFPATSSPFPFGHMMEHFFITNSEFPSTKMVVSHTSSCTFGPSSPEVSKTCLNLIPIIETLAPDTLIIGCPLRSE